MASNQITIATTTMVTTTVRSSKGLMMQKDLLELIRLLKAVRDSPTLGESSNAVVVDGKTWRRIKDLLDRTPK